MPLDKKNIGTTLKFTAHTTERQQQVSENAENRSGLRSVVCEVNFNVVPIFFLSKGI